jgi:hypothetical protein
LKDIKEVKEMRQLKDEIADDHENLRYSILKLMLIGGIQVGYIDRSEFKEHFNELVKSDDIKYIMRKEQYEIFIKDKDFADSIIDDFTYEAFHLINRCKNFINMKEKIPRTVFITGNDGDLQYFYECVKCKSLIVVDHGSSSHRDPIVCTHCIPNYDSDHELIEVNSAHWLGLRDWVKFEKRMNTDPVFKKFIEFKWKLRSKFYKFTPSYYKAMKEIRIREAKEALK